MPTTQDAPIADGTVADGLVNVLAPYASWPERSRGRLHAEAESPGRSAFQRDRDRVIHSTAFRRLQYKTQVFIFHEGDHYRTRLTHSLEVAQIARSIARRLSGHEDLAEALALAHDLGHTPFGHAGEAALDEAMAQHGGFDHNAQALRILTRLEHRYAGFDGLNLTWETLEGVVKHNGPLIARPDADQTALPYAVRAYGLEHDLELHTFAGLEAQAAALADDVAYNNHDIDDGLRAGLFTIDELRDLPMARDVVAEVTALHPNLEPNRRIPEVVRRLINQMVSDLMSETRRRIDQAAPQSAEDIRLSGQAMVGFSAGMEKAVQAIRRFLFVRMYRHPRVTERSDEARQVVSDLFLALNDDPARLPNEWAALTDGRAGPDTARVVADYIAGMTDRYAFREHERLYPERRPMSR